MKELIITTVSIVIVYVLTKIITINNDIIKELLNLIPIIIPTTFMWLRLPKNYLKFMYFKSINIKYQIDIRLDECNINLNNFKELRKHLLGLDQTNESRILKENFGKLIYLSTIEVNTGIIDLAYYVEDQNLIIQSKDKIKYKLFFKVAEDIFTETNKMFVKEENGSYNSENTKARIRIQFIDKNETDSKNPFWEKIFFQFKNKIVNFTYQTSNNNNILISTDLIDISGNDLRDINDDIKKELTLLRFKN